MLTRRKRAESYSQRGKSPAAAITASLLLHIPSLFLEVIMTGHSGKRGTSEKYHYEGFHESLCEASSCKHAPYDSQY